MAKRVAQSNWACVSYENPKTSKDLFVIRVKEELGVQNQVTWLRPGDAKEDKQKQYTFKLVYGPVAGTRAQARKNKEEAIKSLSLRRVSSHDYNSNESNILDSIRQILSVPNQPFSYFGPSLRNFGPSLGSISVGSNSYVSGNDSIAIGDSAHISGNDSIAIGQSSYTTDGTDCIAIGDGATATSDSVWERGVPTITGGAGGSTSTGGSVTITGGIGGGSGSGGSITLTTGAGRNIALSSGSSGPLSYSYASPPYRSTNFYTSYTFHNLDPSGISLNYQDAVDAALKNLPAYLPSGISSKPSPAADPESTPQV